MATKEVKIKKPRGAAVPDGIPQKAKKIVVPKVAKIPKPKPAKVSLKKEKVSHTESGDSKIVLRIRVRAYESKILDASVKQIMDTATRYDATIVGPVPLPTEIKKYTVNRSPFIYKNTREQFEIRVHKRLIDIVNPNAKTIEALTNLSLPSGVDIEVKML